VAPLGDERGVVVSKRRSIIAQGFKPSPDFFSSFSDFLIEGHIYI
jgi:hypothetical protein